MLVVFVGAADVGGGGGAGIGGRGMLLHLESFRQLVRGIGCEGAGFGLLDRVRIAVDARLVVIGADAAGFHFKIGIVVNLLIHLISIRSSFPEMCRQILLF